MREREEREREERESEEREKREEREVGEEREREEKGERRERGENGKGREKVSQSTIDKEQENEEKDRAGRDGKREKREKGEKGENAEKGEEGEGAEERSGGDAAVTIWRLREEVRLGREELSVCAAAAQAFKVTADRCCHDTASSCNEITLFTLPIFTLSILTLCHPSRLSLLNLPRPSLSFTSVAVISLCVAVWQCRCVTVCLRQCVFVSVGG